MEEEGPVIKMTWNLAEYLPKHSDCQTSFHNIIASYINTIYEKMQEGTGRHTPGCTPMKRASSQASQHHNTNKTCTEFAQELVAGQLAQKLYFLTQQIHKKGQRSDEAEEGLPLNTSSHHMPALEFVKSVTKVLGLDSTVAQEVRLYLFS